MTPTVFACIHTPVRTSSQKSPMPWGLIVAGAAAGAALLVTLFSGLPEGLLDPPPAPSASGTSSASAQPLPLGLPDDDTPKIEPRCKDIARDAFVIGELPSSPKTPNPDENDTNPADDPLAPFAVSVGRGTLTNTGFAVGTLRDAEGGTVAALASLDFDGKNGVLIRLSRSRGDMEPPAVAGAGDAVIAVVPEPNASGRALKIVKIKGQDVTWGAEFSEGRDDSLAMDIAVSGERAALVWDDVPLSTKRSTIFLSTADVATLLSVTPARPISPPGVDADSPRLITRPGGFWLAYAAQAEAPAPKEEKGGKTKGGGRAKGDVDETQGGETIVNRWVEVIPLDTSGAAVGLPRAVTPKDGHLLAFDIELSPEGGALISVRDDDTPSGSGGGRVSTVLVEMSGAREAKVLAEEGFGVGVPELLPGWILLFGLSGPPEMAQLSPATGELIGDFVQEPGLGIGAEVLAAASVHGGEKLLVSRPAGKALKLSIAACEAKPAAPAPAGSP